MFVDSNIIINALVAPASPAGFLLMWASLQERPYVVVVAKFVRMEVERALARQPSDLTEHFRAQLALVRPLSVRLPTAEEVAARPRQDPAPA